MPKNKSVILYLNTSDKGVIPVSIEDICFIQYSEEKKTVGGCTKAGFIFTQDDFWKISKPFLDHCGKDCAYMYINPYDCDSGTVRINDIEKVPVRFPISNSNNGVFVLYNKNLIDYIDKGSVETYPVINTLFIKGIISKEKFTRMIENPESWITLERFTSDRVKRNILNRLEPDHKLIQTYIELIKRGELSFSSIIRELNEETQNYISSRLLPDLTTGTAGDEMLIWRLASIFSSLTLPLQQEVLTQACKRYMCLLLPAGYMKMSMISDEVRDLVETDQHSRFLFLSLFGRNVFYDDKDASDLEEFVSGLRHKFLTDLNDSFFSVQEIKTHFLLGDSVYTNRFDKSIPLLFRHSDRAVSVLLEMKDEPFISEPENRKKWLHYLISTALTYDQLKETLSLLQSRVAEVIDSLDLSMSPDFLPEARDYMIKLLQKKPASAPSRNELGRILKLYHLGFLPKEVLLEWGNILKEYSSAQDSNTLLGLLLSGVIPESHEIYKNLKTKLSNRNPGLKVLFHGLTKGMELN